MLLQCERQQDSSKSWEISIVLHILCYCITFLESEVTIFVQESGGLNDQLV